MLAAMKRRTSRGVSLVEVMVAIGVLGILVSVAAPSFSDMMTRRRVRAVAAEIATDLAYARSEAALRPQEVFLDFRANANTSCYTVQTSNTSMNCNCTLDPNARCPTSNFGQSPELKTMQVANSTGVRFTPSSATFGPTTRQRVGFVAPQLLATMSDFAVDISGGTVSLRVQMTLLGHVSTCSPNGTFGGGIPSC